MSDFGELASRVHELEGRLPPELRGDGPIVSGGGGTVGPDGTTYEVAAADAGTSITCTVTATNPQGTLAAPSNALAIPAAAGAASAAAASRSTSHAHSDAARPAHTSSGSDKK